MPKERTFLYTQMSPTDQNILISWSVNCVDMIKPTRHSVNKYIFFIDWANSYVCLVSSKLYQGLPVNNV